jgi:hypothetical protein
VSNGLIFVIDPSIHSFTLPRHHPKKFSRL